MSANIYKNRLADLRAVLKGSGLDGFLVPRADQYPGEFVSARAERLAWLTGFTGSAGVGVVLAGKAAVFTDGRYTLQLQQQIDRGLYESLDMAHVKIGDWIAGEASAGHIIGYDPWLYTPDQIASLSKAIAAASLVLRPVDENPVDLIWNEKPYIALSDVEIFPENIAGSISLDKRRDAAVLLKEENVFAFIIGMPDSIAWLLNIRGRDADHTPVVLSHAILYADHAKVTWFVDPKRISGDLTRHLGPDVQIVHPERMIEILRSLAVQAQNSGHKIGVDYARTPLWFKNFLEQEKTEIVHLKDPCILPKALKTSAEQKSIRDVHVRDGVAMVRFLSWFDHEAPRGSLTELQVIERLEHFRKDDPTYREPSFSTIAGYGPNGAIIHYRATPETDLKLISPGLFLLDSGGQYAWGTTDITRTLAVGEAAAEMRRAFTLVLKGHIALATVCFDRDMTGAQLDDLARRPLLREGLHYAHGTGHDVGCYLSVHEEAASISPRGQEPLQPGMLLSNEPGYYKAGAYGIRIENLMLVIEREEKLAFDIVTMVPIDRRLIDVDLLSSEELEWINSYHVQVRNVVSPLVESDVRDWLTQATAPL